MKKRVLSLILCVSLLPLQMMIAAMPANVVYAEAEHVDTSEMTDIKDADTLTEDTYKITDYTGLTKLQTLSQDKIPNFDPDAKLKVELLSTVPVKDTDVKKDTVPVKFKLYLNEALDYPVSVNYRTLEGSAKADTHYTPAQGTAVIAAGETETSVEISIRKFGNGDNAETRWDGRRNFIVQFYDPVNINLSLHGTDPIAVTSCDRSISYSVSLERVAQQNGFPATYITDTIGTNFELYSDFSGVKVAGENHDKTSVTCKLLPITLDLNPISKIKAAYEDSDAPGIKLYLRMDAGIDWHNDAQITCNASLSDANGNVYYDSADYGSWPDPKSQYENKYIFWAGNKNGKIRSELIPFFYATRAKYDQFINQKYITFYDMYISNATTEGYDVFSEVIVGLQLYDFIKPVIKKISAPTGTTFKPGDVIPITVEFSEAVRIPHTTRLKVNGENVRFAGYFTGASGSSQISAGKYATFLYTVKEPDNASSLTITDKSLSEITDLTGNEIDLTGGGVSGAIDLSPDGGGYTVTGMTIESPLESRAIYSVETDKSTYNAKDDIIVTLTDYPDSAVSLWLRNTLDKDFELGGAYLAVLDQENGETDTYPFAVKTEATGEGSCTYEAKIPASNYVTADTSSLRLALYYGSDVTKADSSFSGGTLAWDKIKDVELNAPVLITDITLNEDKYPENNKFYLTAATAVTLEATATPAFGATFPDIEWESSDDTVATIDNNGAVYPVRAGRVAFTAKACNGGFGTVSAVTPEFVVSDGGPPAIVIPSNANRFSTKGGEDVTVKWNTNLKYENTDFTVSVYKGGSSSGEEVYSETFSGPERLTSPSLTIGGSLLTEISPADADLVMAPAYTYKVSAINPDNPLQILSAEGYIIVYPQPASVTLDRPENIYITDSTSSVNIGWTLSNMLGDHSETFTLKIFKNDEATPVYSTDTIKSGHQNYTLSISKVGGGRLRDVYMIQAVAINATGPGYDTYTLYVYDNDALEIMVKDATGSDVTPDNGQLTLSNRNYIANLYNQEGSKGILDLARDINLQRYISINYGQHAWGVISDQIEWLSVSEAVATLNYRQGSRYEPLSAFTYTKYPPGATLSLAGESDGTARIYATHALTGQEVFLDVTVETLKDKLYLFQFYPRQKTTVTYKNASGAEITIDSDANGSLAIYEPEGIKSNVSLQSGSGDMIYLGTIYKNRLKSGEQDGANLGLYPMNILQLRNTKLEIYLKDTDGNPWGGSTKYSGAVYKNDELCSETILRDEMLSVGDDGLFALNLDASKFWINDNSETLAHDDNLRFSFVLECGSKDQYYPVLVEVNGNLNTQDLVSLGANITQLRTNTYLTPNPFVAVQTVSSPYLLGETDVLDNTASIGPGNRVPKEVLRTIVLWWGETPDDNYGLRMENKAGAALKSQSVHTYTLPFYDASVSVNETVLSNATIGVGTVLNLKPGETTQITMSLLKGNSSLYKRQNAAFTIANGVGLIDPKDSPVLKEDLENISKMVEDKEAFNSSMVEGDAKNIMKALEILEKVTMTSAGRLIVEYVETCDPLYYIGIITLGTDDTEYGPVSFDMSFELFDILSLKGSAYLRADIRHDSTLEEPGWTFEVVGGGFYVSAAIGGDELIFTTNIPLGPIPVTVKMGLQFGVDFSMQFLRSPKLKTKTDLLLTVGMGAGITAFAGLGFDSSDLLAINVGLYGEMMLRGYFANLSIYNRTEAQDIFDGYVAAVLNASGEIGLKGELTVLCFSRSVSIKIAEFSRNLATIGDWNSIRDWVKANKIKDDFDIYTAEDIADIVFKLASDGDIDTAAAVLCAVSGGLETEVEKGSWQLEGRDYLGSRERAWNTPGRMRTSGSSGLSLIQSNAYPNSDPLISDDGKLLLYKSDGNSTDLNEMNISWALSETDQGAVDPTIDALPMAGEFDLDGTSAFAAAAWSAQRENVNFTDENAVTDEEFNTLLTGSEIVASVYSDGSWNATRLTDDNQTDMSPIAAAGAGKAFVAWHSMAGTGVKDIGEEGEELNFSNVSHKIVYRMYDNGSWGNAAALYNGNLGPVCSMDAAMLESGAVAVVFTLDLTGNVDSTGYETFCTILRTDNSMYTLRLTDNEVVDLNAKVKAVDFGGSEGEQFVVGWYQQKGGGAGDIMLAAVSGEGKLLEGFSDSVSETLKGQGVSIANDFRLVLSADRGLNDLCIVWSELCDPERVKDDVPSMAAASSVLRCVKLCSDGGEIYFSAPLTMAESAKETQIMHFDGWYNDTAKEIETVMLITDYSANNKGSDLYKASAYFGNSISAMAIINQEEIIHDFDTAFTFVLTNLGTDVLDEAAITLSDGSSERTFRELKLFPNSSIALNLPYYVPAAANSIKDLAYTLKAKFSGGDEETATGILDIAVPDIGITSMEPVDSGNGLRTFRVSLQNLSDVEFYNNTEGYEAWLGIYTDSGFTNIAKDSGGANMLYNFTGMDLSQLDGSGLTKLITYELPSDGFENGDIRLYARAFAMERTNEIEQYYTGNDTGIIIFSDPVAANDGNPIFLTVEQSNVSDKTEAKVTVTNLSFTPATNGNLAVSLLDAAGRVLETRLYTDQAGSLIYLGKEDSRSFDFTFSKSGYNVRAGYYTADPSAMNADLSALQLSSIAFAFDSKVNDYSLTAKNLGNTTLTAAASNPAATVEVLDTSGRVLSSGTGAVSYTLRLPTDSQAEVGVRVIPEDVNAASNTYKFQILNEADNSEVAISASGATVTVSAQTDFTPAFWRINIDGNWSANKAWGTQNKYVLPAGDYLAVYARVYDENDKYVDSNVLSVFVPRSGKTKANTEGELLNYTLSGALATLSIPDDKLSDILEAAEGILQFDLVDLAGVRALELPSLVLQAVAQAGLGIEVLLPGGIMHLGPKVLTSVFEQAEGENITISIYQIENSALTPKQQNAVGNRPVYSASILTERGREITDFEGASITVSMSYELGYEEESAGVSVWYIGSDGELVNMPSIYDEAEKIVRFTTNHLSYYAIRYEMQLNPFKDVGLNDWFYDSVIYAYQNGLFAGTKTDTFSPEMPMTRAMLVTVLWRIEGEPLTSDTAKFTDAASNQWYTQAVSWAAENGIITGYGGGLFGTDDSITREQLATILYNYAKFKNREVVTDAVLTGFDDRKSVSKWAEPGMRWAAGEKLILGVTQKTLDPKGNATRAQVAAILQRYIERTDN